MSSIGASVYRRGGKRLLDLALLAAALPALLPVAGVIALWVRLRLGPPVLFRQARPGYQERIFTLYKFRTMTDARDERGELLPDARRVTAFGHFLRKTSLDEIPELINVLKGEMSLVGPRPLLIRYLPYYSEEERARFAVRPGITGWAQVHGRNNLSWNDRLALDCWYAAHHSLALDVKILWRTLLQVLRGKDVQVVPNLVMADLDEERRPSAAERWEALP